MFPIGTLGILTITVCGAIAFFITLLLARFMQWPKRRSMLVAAVPVPGVAAVLAVTIFFWSTSLPEEKCGIDACGMGMAAAMSLFVMALLAFAVGLALANVAFGLVRK